MESKNPTREEETRPYIHVCNTRSISSETFDEIAKLIIPVHAKTLGECLEIARAASVSRSRSPQTYLECASLAIVEWRSVTTTYIHLTIEALER